MRNLENLDQLFLQMCRRDDVAGDNFLNHEMACSQRLCKLISGQVLGSHRTLNALRKLRVAFHAITSERKRPGMLLKLRQVMFAWQPLLRTQHFFGEKDAAEIAYSEQFTASIGFCDDPRYRRGFGQKWQVLNAVRFGQRPKNPRRSPGIGENRVRVHCMVAQLRERTVNTLLNFRETLARADLLSCGLEPDRTLRSQNRFSRTLHTRSNLPLSGCAT